MMQTFQRKCILGTIALVCAACSPTARSEEVAPAPPSYANRFDAEVAGVFDAREKDWRNGALVYQVLVDRFAPSVQLEQKRSLYPPPKVLHRWTDKARRGSYRPELNIWSHEIDFWGGDLQSVGSRLAYLQGLGVDVLYLNPIHLAYTNHKYDALDYLKISPEFGTMEDLQTLTQDVHRNGMKLVLDGVFNHMGRNADIFKQAQADPQSPYRSWFYFGTPYPGGARGWF